MVVKIGPRGWELVVREGLVPVERRNILVQIGYALRDAQRGLLPQDSHRLVSRYVDVFPLMRSQQPLLEIIKPREILAKLGIRGWHATRGGLCVPSILLWIYKVMFICVLV